MAEKEKETKEFGQKITTDPDPEPEPTTPTLEEQLTALQSEKESLTKERDEATKGLKTAHSRLTDKDKEIRGKNAVNTRIDGLEETTRVLVGMLNERLASGELDESQKTDYLAKFDAVVKEQKATSDQAVVKAQQEEDYKHRDELWSKAKEFGTYEENDNVAEIYDALMEGKTYKAERIIKKLEKTTDTKEKKVESEEERINKLVDEKLRLKMEEKGMLESETGGPSGASPNDEQIRKNFRENPNDPKAYQEYHAYLTRTGQSHK